MEHITLEYTALLCTIQHSTAQHGCDVIDSVGSVCHDGKSSSVVE